MILNFVEGFRVASAWSRAYAASVRGDYETALKSLRSISFHRRQKPFHWRLFEVVQLSLLERNAEAYSGVSALIEAMKEKAELSIDELYFLSHAKWCGSNLYRKLNPGAPIPTDLTAPQNLFDRREVQKRWLRTFPMPASRTPF